MILQVFRVFLLTIYFGCQVSVAWVPLPGPTKTVRHVATQSTQLFVIRPDEPVNPTHPSNVQILSDAKAVGAKVRQFVKECAQDAIDERGHFCLAIPGGSILNMLAGGDEIVESNKEKEWMSKTTIAYVNHKCVDMDDIQLATHAKAREKFLDQWKGVTVLELDGTANGEQEATRYEAKIKELSNDVLPREIPSGLPIFDLSLIGVGDDGHIGSLYPGREEVLVGETGPWVLPVNMKDPPSITLSLPVMAASRKVVVAACGVSEKYPQGKSDGMRRAIADETETLQSFPAVGLREVALWVLDEPAASKLGDTYKEEPRK